MKVLLIRHADQEGPVDDQGRRLVSLPESPLSKLGEKQTHALARELEKNSLTPDGLYLSPYLRTVQTARLLQKDLDIVNLETVNDLREVDPNSGQGHTLEEMKSIDGDIYSHPFNPNQETLEHLIKRVRSAFEYVESNANTNNFTTIGIVSHGDPLCALYWALRNEGIPESTPEMKKNYYPKKGEALEFVYENGKIQGDTRIITTQDANKTA